eukprot:TRINITY_DN49_c0_g1_i4.p1 TRINITY_DN49_c0_g1~~TRINITY_DN49_c0_g1_i4.p1  ORF type:complete len:454 (-),score=41.40 TRINITY_DN49_c0_g1_i4:461-1822(-)
MIRYATITVVLALLLPGFKTDELLDVEFGPFLHTHEDCEYILPVSSNVRGGTAVSNAVPYMVSLQKSIDSEQKWFMHTCAGTFIDEGIILTAAHCIWEEGRFDFRQEPKGYQGQVKEELKAAIAPLCRHDQGKGRVKIYDYYINPEYDAGQVWQGSDIAILVLGQDFYNLNYQTQFVQVDPIAASGLSNLQVYGWGAVNKEDQALFSTTILPLQQAQLRHTSVSECMESGKFTNLNDNDFVCATFIGGDITGVQDTCAGDSGGPLFVSDPNSEYAVHQIGITSFGGDETCGDEEGKPAVYTRISAHSQWVADTLSKIKGTSNDGQTSSGNVDGQSGSGDEQLGSQNGDGQSGDSNEQTGDGQPGSETGDGQSGNDDGQIPEEGPGAVVRNTWPIVSACPRSRCIGIASQCCSMDPSTNNVCSTSIGSRTYTHAGVCADGQHVWEPSFGFPCYC